MRAQRLIGREVGRTAVEKGKIVPEWSARRMQSLSANVRVSGTGKKRVGAADTM